MHVCVQAIFRVCFRLVALCRSERKSSNMCNFFRLYLLPTESNFHFHNNHQLDWTWLRSGLSFFSSPLFVPLRESFLER